ncbi:MAG TPA: hypothetical protein VFQ25_09715 [Ktedonobacterales bacterium]|nr:hypothetical protein [Ktedonobacterales bacterium]
MAVLFLGFNTHTAFGSGSGGGGCFSTTGPVCTFKGHQASADFSSVSDDGCVYTDAYVGIFESLSSPSRTDSQTVFVYISQWDNCTGALLANATNFDPNSSMPTFTGTMQFGDQSASINGTAAMYDYNSGQSFTTTINVSWKGYGPVSSIIDSQHYRSPGFILNSHSTSASQSAEAAGVITDQTGTNLATPPTLNANISDDSGGTVQMFRV